LDLESTPRDLDHEDSILTDSNLDLDSDHKDLDCELDSTLVDLITSLQFSSVQFSRINVVLSAKHFRTTTQYSVIDAVVAGKEMSSGVAGMRTKMVRGDTGRQCIPRSSSCDWECSVAK